MFRPCAYRLHNIKIYLGIVGGSLEAPMQPLRLHRIKTNLGIVGAAHEPPVKTLLFSKQIYAMQTIRFHGRFKPRPYEFR